MRVLVGLSPLDKEGESPRVKEEVSQGEVACGVEEGGRGGQDR